MDKFTSKHVAFFILGTAVISLKTYPAIYMKSGGKDSWVAVIISSLLIIFYFLYILYICKKTNNYNICDIYKKALGNILGTLFLLFFVMTLILTLVESSSVEASSMHTNMLILNPPWSLLVLFIFPALYTIKKGKVAIIIVTLIGITLIMFAGINLSILTAKYKQLKYLFPIFTNGVTLGFIFSLIKSFGMYGGLGIVLPYLNEIGDKVKLKRDSLIGLIILVQMEIIASTGIIMTFSINRANNISYPKLIQTQLVSHFGFLENGELYVMLQIVGGWFIKYILSFFAILLILKQLKIKNKYMDYILTIVVFIISYYCSKNLFTLFKLLDYYTYICLLNYIIIPTIVITIFYIRTKSAEAKGIKPA
ncbi:GerAB/ArcD/ProY family transporter [Candidatus Clostridium radicumherbarum]|uniref:Endospore germination permease n=1 Tax=Candidatus Clostridium radicumherbarum TaxID=3381662 RepID=A0ABW8TVH1_9CLOT